MNIEMRCGHCGKLKADHPSGELCWRPVVIDGPNRTPGAEDWDCCAETSKKLRAEVSRLLSEVERLRRHVEHWERGDFANQKRAEAAESALAASRERERLIFEEQFASSMHCQWILEQWQLEIVRRQHAEARVAELKAALVARPATAHRAVRVRCFHCGWKLGDFGDRAEFTCPKCGQGYVAAVGPGDAAATVTHWHRCSGSECAWHEAEPLPRQLVKALFDGDS